MIEGPLNSPDTEGAHVGRGAVSATHIEGLRGLEEVGMVDVGGPVHSLEGSPGLFGHSLLHHTGRQTIGGAGPDFTGLHAAGVHHRPGGSEPVGGAHVASVTSHHVVEEDLMQSGLDPVRRMERVHAACPGVPLSGQGVGHEGVGLLATRVVVVERAIPQGLQHPTGPFPLRGKVGRVEGKGQQRGHGGGGREGGDPETPAVGTDPEGIPCVVCLVGEVLVLYHAVSVSVKDVEVQHRLKHHRPHVPQEDEVSCGHIVAVDLEDELAVEVFPVGDVMDTVRVGLQERIP
mmetsp:Transcript_31001/g.52200  ORF Transcript_31001/g.52200 Transcript_31001/m.52200 type:complete len:289 (-) Transcript_31001:428-1294(-)